MRCNYRAVRWFMKHEAGIWRYGLNGVESLDYGQIRSVMQLAGMKKNHRKKLFQQLLHIEQGFIITINQERKKNKNRA